MCSTRSGRFRGLRRGRRGGGGEGGSSEHEQLLTLLRTMIQGCPSELEASVEERLDRDEAVRDGEWRGSAKAAVQDGRDCHKLYEMVWRECTRLPGRRRGGLRSLSAATLANSMRVLMTRAGRAHRRWCPHGSTRSLMTAGWTAPALLPPPEKSALAYASGLSAPQISGCFTRATCLRRSPP